MSQIKVAIVGCGRIAQRHAKILSSGQVDGAELVAVCDIVSEKASALARNNGIIPYFVDMQIMTQVVEPDLITLCTPSGMHYEHIMSLAECGIPLLVEKPLCLTLDQIDSVIDLGVRICEVKQNRYNVAVQYLVEALDKGKLGVPHMASVRVWWSRGAEYYQDWHGEWSQAGGVLANQAIHHVDLLQWLMGPVERVSAFAQYSDYTEVETGLVASLEFKSGAIGTIEATTLTQPCDLEGSLAVLGSKGTVEVGGFAANKIYAWHVGDVSEKKLVENTCENPPDVYGFGHIKLYENVIRCLQDGSEFPVPPQEARKALEMCHAIYESVNTGEMIELGWEYYSNSWLGR